MANLDFLTDSVIKMAMAIKSTAVINALAFFYQLLFIHNNRFLWPWSCCNELLYGFGLRRKQLSIIV